MTQTRGSELAHQRFPGSWNRRLVALCALLMSCALAGCASDSRPVVVISVDGLTPLVQSIRATVTLGGQTDVEVFNSGLAQFGLRLPMGASGPLGLTLEALRSDQCIIASGTGNLNVAGGQSRLDIGIGLTPLSSPACGGADLGGPTYSITVTKSATGTSNGVITSTPAGISCGAACSATFTQGTTATLDVVPDYRSLFLGWSGACTAVGGTCSLAVSSALTATARFGTTACSLDRVCQKLPTPLPAIKWRAVWGTSATNVWVVGAGGNIMHWDGALFTPVQSGTTSDLFSIWGAGPNDFWVGANTGLVLRWNGTTFNQQTLGTAQAISGIWGSGINDVWFLDGSTSAYHFTGTGFPPIATGSGSSLTAIWGSSANDFWVTTLSGNVAHYVGTGFSLGPSSTTSLLTGISGSGATDVWAVSAYNSMAMGASIIHYDGAVWKTIANNIPDFLSGVAVTAGEVWAVGTNGALWRSTGGAFTRQSTGTTSNLNAAFTSALNDAWLVGDSGVILRREP